MSESPPPLGHSSTITIALLAVFVGLAFSLGVGYQRLNANEADVDRLTLVVEQQAEIIRQNARRLDLLDRTLAELEVARHRDK